jgi:hypothetical protein
MDLTNSVRNKEQADSFLSYEDKIFQLRKMTFLAGYDLSIDVKSGLFYVYEYDSHNLLIKIESMLDLTDWLLENWIK